MSDFVELWLFRGMVVAISVFGLYALARRLDSAMK